MTNFWRCQSSLNKRTTEVFTLTHELCKHQEDFPNRRKARLGKTRSCEHPASTSKLGEAEQLLPCYQSAPPSIDWQCQGFGSLLSSKGQCLHLITTYVHRRIRTLQILHSDSSPLHTHLTARHHGYQFHRHAPGRRPQR